jgi:hypothetical protein
MIGRRFRRIRVQRQDIGLIDQAQFEARRADVFGFSRIARVSAFGPPEAHGTVCPNR